jgi:hypothetical protein
MKLNIIVNIFFKFLIFFFLLLLIYSINIFFKTNSYYFIIIFLFLLTLFLINFLATSDFKKKFLFYFFLIFFLIYFIESLIIFFNFYNEKKNYVINKGLKNGTNYRLELAKKLNSNEILTIHPSNNFKDFNERNILPLAGVANKKTYFCNNAGFVSAYLSDRYGFNNKDYIYEENKLDLIIIGDSFIHGACVNQENTISEKLNNKFGIKTINFSYGGNGPLLEFATLKEYALNYKSDYLVWAYFAGNDLIDLKREKDSFLNVYLNNADFSQDLINRQNRIDIFLQEKNKLDLNKVIKNQNKINENKYKSFLTFFNTRYMFIHQVYKFYKLDLPYKEFKLILESSKSLSEATGKKFIFLYIPSRYVFNNTEAFAKYFLSSRLVDSKYALFSKKKIIDLVKSLDVEIIDIEEIIINKKIDVSNLYPLNFQEHHFNENGYEFVAEEITKTIIFNNNFKK